MLTKDVKKNQTKQVVIHCGNCLFDLSSFCYIFLLHVLNLNNNVQMIDSFADIEGDLQKLMSTKWKADIVARASRKWNTFWHTTCIKTMQKINTKIMPNLHSILLNYAKYATMFMFWHLTQNNNPNLSYFLIKLFEVIPLSLFHMFHHFVCTVC